MLLLFCLGNKKKSGAGVGAGAGAGVGTGAGSGSGSGSRVRVKVGKGAGKGKGKGKGACVEHNVYEPNQSEAYRAAEVKRCLQRARSRQVKAFVTWEYPPVEDEKGRGECESHCVMLIFSPDETVVCVDSRGPAFAPGYSASWARSHKRLRGLFRGCVWTDAVQRDMQLTNPNDNFCQTWSLILAVEVETTGVDCARLEGLMRSYDALIAFWRELMRHSRFRQLVYLEVYRMTHDDAGRRYPTSLPYFSTLEALVTGGYSGNYPTQNYRKSGYSFVEEFVLELDHHLLCEMLR
ncbi:hypothetical protein B484DRAFT_406952 [Ochromonadaceae sp. CCMP2298]|nr:hypothetical protein B484DRAFT_406952 [Ochromonadaceae sp. CCMP2298]